MTEGSFIRPVMYLLAIILMAAGGAHPAWAKKELTPFAIGYLELSDDPRYEERRRYTGLRLKMRKRPFDGAQVSLRDSRFIGKAVGVKFALERRSDANGAELIAAIGKLSREKKVRFFLIDAPASVLSQVARADFKNEIVLFNISEPDDSLRRENCHRRLLHVIPSRAMLSDALMQYLVARNWKKVLVLKGPLPGDGALVAAIEKSARKFGGKIIAVKPFKLGNDPRNRDKNNIALMTAGIAYDVLYIADSDGEFGRYVPFQTQQPRPVVGTEGLSAEAWHWTWERHGAPQLNQRFDKRAKRRMQSADWAAWVAVKAVVEAVARTKSTGFSQVNKYLRGETLTLDTYKGTPASFRPWNGQLRQPIVLHTHNAVIERAPIPGFLHSRTDLDTLGADINESKCRL
jgi:ABC transporter substrate binding protein (PQQ-dependent alcohol dehydrogenase system)